MRLSSVSTVTGLSIAAVSAIVALSSLPIGGVSAQSTSSSSMMSSSSSVSSLSSGLATDLSVVGNSPSTAMRQGLFTDTFIVTNKGPGIATNVTLTIALPQGVLFRASSSDSRCALMGTSVVCSLGSLVTTAPTTAQVAFTTPRFDSCMDSSITVYGQVDSSQTDSATANNQSSGLLTVIQCPASSSSSAYSAGYVDDAGTLRTQRRIEEYLRLNGLLSSSSSSSSRMSSSSMRSSSSVPSTGMSQNVRLSLSADQSEVQPGGTVTYTITLRNLSSDPVDGAQLVLNYPADLLTVSANGATMSNGMVSWEVAMGPSQTRVVRFSGVVSDSATQSSDVEVTARLLGLATSPVSVADVSVISKLPQTGISDYLSPLGDASRFLSPMSADGQGLLLWSLAVPMLLAGAVFGRKIFS